jgi:DNA-binding HxlR family transcriptional regulator
VLGSSYENEECSAAATLAIVGERWSLLILRDAMFRGFTRFSQFQRSLGVATNILGKRLEKFVEHGLMERHQAEGQAPEYRLTRKGLELKPVLVALTEWGDRWVAPGPVVYVDGTGESAVGLRLLRDGDRAAVDVSEVTVRRRGPAG